MIKMRRKRIKTYIDGLDEIIEGGFPLSSSVLLVGGPGAGKTTFSAQFIHNGAKNKEKGAIVLIGQTVEKFKNDMTSHNIDFEPLIKKDLVRIYELPIYDKKFDANFSNLVLELSTFGAKRIVMDSFSMFFSTIETRDKHKEIIRLLKYLTKDSVLMLTLEKHEDKTKYPDEFFATDAVIDLGFTGKETERRLRIVKMRQTNHSLEKFSYKITDEGIKIIKKPELNHPGSVSFKKVKTGSAGLDEALGGGFYKGTTVLVAGNSGTGKTISGLQFLLEGAKTGEKSLYVSFEESENEIMRNVASLGWSPNKYIKDGSLEFLSLYPENSIPDELISIVNNKIKDGRYKRVVVDSITRLVRSMDQDSYLEFLKQICATCRSQLATLFVLGEIPGGDGIDHVSQMSISSLVEGIIILKHIELLGEMKRSLMIVKLRGVKHDKKIKEFTIGEGGLHIRGNLKDMETLIPAVSEAI
jgi:circadian clock protein KaiC